MKRFSIGKKASGVIAIATAFMVGVTPMTAFAQANDTTEEVIVETKVQESDVVVDIVKNMDETSVSGNSVEASEDTELAYNYTSPAFNGSSTARDEVGKLMQICLTSTEADVDAMIKKAFKDAVAECKYQAGE